MQQLIGNMTADQFTQFIGLLIGCVIIFFGSFALIEALVHSIIDGWLFRKGALYYGSLRYLNKLFKKLKTIKSIDTKRKEAFETYPKFKEAYIRTFDRMLQSDFYKINKPTWNSGEEVFAWWVSDKQKKIEMDENQLTFESEVLKNV